jgi:uncharacterized protein
MPCTAATLQEPRPCPSRRPRRPGCASPCASRNGLDGIAPGADGRPALRLRVAAPAVEGAANAALIDFVARSLRMRKSDLAIVSGERGRSKLLELRGDSADLLARLAAWMEAERRRS